MKIFQSKKSKQPAKPEPAAASLSGRAERKAERAERRAARASAALMGEQVQSQTAVKKDLRGTAPKASTANLSEHEAKRFEKMTYKERLNLFNSNPQAYKKLAEGAKTNA